MGAVICEVTAGKARHASSPRTTPPTISPWVSVLATIPAHHTLRVEFWEPRGPVKRTALLAWEGLLGLRNLPDLVRLGLVLSHCRAVFYLFSESSCLCSSSTVPTAVSGDFCFFLWEKTFLSLRTSVSCCLHSA